MAGLDGNCARVGVERAQQGAGGCETGVVCCTDEMACPSKKIDGLQGGGPESFLMVLRWPRSLRHPFKKGPQIYFSARGFSGINPDRQAAGLAC